MADTVTSDSARPDPVLDAHLIAPLSFSVSQRVDPISIRDQMLRACLIVERAVERQVIGPRRRLLVVGAGAAGVTAAIRAAQLGAAATVLENKANAFLTQAKTTTRWIDPAQYDWPLRHWDSEKYPWVSPPVPLPFGAERANAVAIGWNRELQRARDLFEDRLTVVFGAENMWISLPGEFPAEDAIVASWNGLPAETFGAILYCTGTGPERHTLKEYQGFAFWDTDRWEEPNLGLASLSRARALISGGGDGALQDFIRITTGLKSARELYQRVMTPALEEAAVLRGLHCAEDGAQRAYAWSTRDHDHRIDSALTSIYSEVVRTALADATVMEKMKELLPRRDAAGMSVALQFSQPHLGRSYGLNRFLTLLIARFLEQRGEQVLFPQTTLESVQGTDHKCVNDKFECYGKTHVATFSSTTNQPTPGGPFHIIVIRHGITRRKSDPGPIRQLLPYHLF